MRRGRVKVDGTVVKSPKMKLPVDCVIEVRYSSVLHAAFRMGDSFFQGFRTWARRTLPYAALFHATALC